MTSHVKHSAARAFHDCTRDYKADIETRLAILADWHDEERAAGNWLNAEKIASTITHFQSEIDFIADSCSRGIEWKTPFTGGKQ